VKLSIERDKFSMFSFSVSDLEIFSFHNNPRFQVEKIMKLVVFN